MYKRQGKTSLKNLIRDLLRNFGKTCSSSRSFNNHLGVPISLSNLSFDDKFGVFEVGMSKPGEIKKLSRLIIPHICVITNIGEAHMENFRNVYGIAKAKSEIIDHARMNKPGQGFYKVLAESALRAVKLCQPLRVPTTGYERWKELQLNFDAREMLEG